MDYISGFLWIMCIILWKTVYTSFNLWIDFLINSGQSILLKNSTFYDNIDNYLIIILIPILVFFNKKSNKKYHICYIIKIYKKITAIMTVIFFHL